MENNKFLKDEDCISKLINIRSGCHELFFHSLSDYNSFNKITLFRNIFGVISIIGLIISLFLFMSSASSAIYVVIIDIVLLLIFAGFINERRDMIYHLIIKDFEKRKISIIYSNRNTGTITYRDNHKRISISVFKGYNSHWKNKK